MFTFLSWFTLQEHKNKLNTPARNYFRDNIIFLENIEINKYNPKEENEQIGAENFRIGYP